MAYENLKKYEDYTLDEVCQLIEYWQCVLNLQAWSITVTLHSRKEYQSRFNDTTSICVSAGHESKLATINLMDFKEHIDKLTERDWEPADDLESAIVHELLHIKLGDVWTFYQDITNDLLSIREKTLLGPIIKERQEQTIEELTAAITYDEALWTAR